VKYITAVTKADIREKIKQNVLNPYMVIKVLSLGFNSEPTKTTLTASPTRYD